MVPHQCSRHFVVCGSTHFPCLLLLIIIDCVDVNVRFQEYNRTALGGLVLSFHTFGGLNPDIQACVASDFTQ